MVVWRNIKKLCNIITLKWTTFIPYLKPISHNKKWTKIRNRSSFNTTERHNLTKTLGNKIESLTHHHSHQMLNKSPLDSNYLISEKQNRSLSNTNSRKIKHNRSLNWNVTVDLTKPDPLSSEDKDGSCYEKCQGRLNLM